MSGTVKRSWQSKLRLLSRAGVATALSLLVVACSQDGQGGRTAGETGDGSYAVRVGTGVPGGLAQLVGATIAQVLNEHAGDRLRATPEAAPSQLTTVTALSEGNLTIGSVAADAAKAALEGEAPFESSYENVRHLMFLWDSAVGFVASADSGIETFQDIEGSGARIGASSPTAVTPLQLLLDEYGLEEGTDYSIEFLSYEDQLNALRSGSLDVASVVMWAESATVEDFAAASSPTFLTIEPEVRQSYSSKYPYLSPVAAPAGTYTGQDEDWFGYGVHLTLAIGADVPEDIAKLIARTIFKNQESLTAVTEAALTITPEDTAAAERAGFFPAGLHEGVVGLLPKGGGQ